MRFGEKRCPSVSRSLRQGCRDCTNRDASSRAGFGVYVLHRAPWASGSLGLTTMRGAPSPTGQCICTRLRDITVGLGGRDNVLITKLGNVIDKATREILDNLYDVIPKK
jgi:hypothetical protein